MTRQAKALTNERGRTHGRFEDVAATSESLLKVMQASVNWSTLSPQRREAIKMITHKLARIGAGNPDEADHWDDIGGYALLGKQNGQTPLVAKARKPRAAKVTKKAAPPARKRTAKKVSVRKRGNVVSMRSRRSGQDLRQVTQQAAEA